MAEDFSGLVNELRGARHLPPSGLGVVEVSAVVVTASVNATMRKVLWRKLVALVDVDDEASPYVGPVRAFLLRPFLYFAMASSQNVSSRSSARS
jgi:hypothetical protein